MVVVSLARDHGLWQPEVRFFRSLFMLCVSGVRITESLGVVPGGRGMMVG